MTPKTNVKALLGQGPLEKATRTLDLTQPAFKQGPPLPPGLFDELYAIPHPWASAGNTDCLQGVPWEEYRLTAESTLLLPGEEQYMRARLAEAGLPWLYRENLDNGILLRIEEVCPYCNNMGGHCPVTPYLPVTRRTWPLRFHKLGTSSLVLFARLGVEGARDFLHVQHVADHLIGQQWIGAWGALTRWISSPDWWALHHRTAPARYLHLGEIVTPEDLDLQRIPTRLLATVASTECADCKGEGVINMAPCPKCLTPAARGRLIDNIQRGDIIRPVHPRKK